MVAQHCGRHFLLVLLCIPKRSWLTASNLTCFLESGGDYSSCVFPGLKIKYRDGLPLVFCAILRTWRVDQRSASE